MKYLIHLVSMLLVVFQAFSARSQPYHTDLVIIGGRASGTMAGIQAAPNGHKHLLIEETGGRAAACLPQLVFPPLTAITNCLPADR